MDCLGFWAHIADDGSEQTVIDHLDGTARRSAAFASDSGSEALGKPVGLAHDIGKNSPAFQGRLKGGPKAEEGLQSSRLSYTWNGRLPAVPSEPEFQNDNYLLSLWTRMLYSCLVDADYLDTEAFLSGGGVHRGGYDSLPELWDRFQRHIAGFFPPRSELNRLRCQILESCMDAGSEQKGIYTLTVPTGRGKTIALLAFALRHAVENNMRRIIYVPLLPCLARSFLIKSPQIPCAAS